MFSSDSQPSALIWSDPFRIELGWLDANGHLNMAYYHVMFDRTIDLALGEIGCGNAYRAAENAAVFTVETHVVYRREVRSDDEVRVSVRLLARDGRRLHTFQQMCRLGDDALMATCESLFVHVDLANRKAAPFPPEIAAAADAMISAHAVVGEEPLVGRRIAPIGEPL